MKDESAISTMPAHGDSSVAYTRVDAAAPADPSGLFTLLDALGPIVLWLRWSVSSTELWLAPDAPPAIVRWAEESARGVIWLSGAELLDLASRVTVANWGAFLGFAPGEDGRTFQQPPRSEGVVRPIQHPRAAVEVQAVDGGYFEVYSGLPVVHALIRRRFEVPHLPPLL